MSKTITIPEGIMNPFVVVHNGITYTYKPGETVEVPDGVALEIEKIAHWDDKFRAPVTPPIGIDAVLAEAKEYTDSQRLAYEEPAVMGKVFECTIPAGENGLYFDAPEGFSFVEGVPVTINGTTLEADYAYAGEGVSFACGDYLSITGTHYWDNIIDGQMCVTAYDPNGQGIDVDRHVSIDVEVVVKEPVVHTIEPKFLGGCVLPVIEVADPETKVLTGETAQVLNDAAEALLPVIMRVNSSNRGWVSCVLQIFGSGEDFCYCCHADSPRGTISTYLFREYAEGQETGNFTFNFNISI